MAGFLAARRNRAPRLDARGEGKETLDIDALDILAESDERVVALDEALNALGQTSPRFARVIECRYFAGYSDKETAPALGIAERIVQRDWTMAKAFLYEAIESWESSDRSARARFRSDASSPGP